jgi:hypothetical protein
MIKDSRTLLLRVLKQAAFACLAMAFTTVAWADNSKLSSDLAISGLPEKVDVVVQFRSMPTQAHHNRVAERSGDQ